MNFNCQGCNTPVTSEQVVRQTLAVTVCTDKHHSGPFGVVGKDTVQTRPVVATATRTAVEV